MTVLQADDAARRAVEAVWRIEAGRLVAGLTRMTRDFGLAEEVAHDALVLALEQWPKAGIPANPAGWLMTTAKRRAIDRHRREATHQRALQVLSRDREIAESADGSSAIDDAMDDQIRDDLLRLVFTACHPALSLESRVALTLRCVGGLTTPQIARGFLVSDATIGQRISRAKRTLQTEHATFELPTPAEMRERLSSVLEVIYLIFNEGYAATSGEQWMRPALCHEALRLGRLVAGLAPGEPEVHGLVALMELQSARIPARATSVGEPVLLQDQDRRRWDRLLIRRGIAALERAESTGRPVGAYSIQAAIAACHARALTIEETDWEHVAELYEVLGDVWPGPVVELNRAVAMGMAFGPAAGLELVDALTDSRELRTYPMLPAVRADLLQKLGRTAEARREFEQAAALTQNESERGILLRRAAECR
ncbi:RNA polymerase sigma factor [Pengzhenrongella sicca]|uniref:RNA polymerase sigma factor n=1 Tax=Pengzhenrongella sicca TaxID=2819238 RepID=A0A8A4ZN68_9MICO|nr:RNA polymerase sigma factor [Pengzhenrongella sicca]QTE30998.1 RNA polymerase sigma factor [Pengzhenrongella sicca]